MWGLNIPHSFLMRLKKIFYKMAYYLWSKSEDGTHAERYIVYYGLQVFLYQLIELIAVLICGIITHSPIPTILVCIGFAISRRIFKGHHARSMEFCMLSSCILITITSLISDNLFVNILLGGLLGYAISLGKIRNGLDILEDILYPKYK